MSDLKHNTLTTAQHHHPSNISPMTVWRVWNWRRRQRYVVHLCSCWVAAYSCVCGCIWDSFADDLLMFDTMEQSRTVRFVRTGWQISYYWCSLCRSYFVVRVVFQSAYVSVQFWLTSMMLAPASRDTECIESLSLLQWILGQRKFFPNCLFVIIHSTFSRRTPPLAVKQTNNLNERPDLDTLYCQCVRWWHVLSHRVHTGSN